MYTIAETDRFKKKAATLWTEEERLAFLVWLASHPLQGDVIPNGGGLRKVRWHMAGKGKRGGVRVIYYNLLADGLIIAADIYAKNERENIGAKDLHNLNDEIKNWDIPAIVAAAVADDPDINPDDLAASLAEIQAGQYHPVTITAITETRHKTGLSQNKFAAALGIPANTLKSWEQGQRKPSGAAAALLKLLDKHPELIHELGA